MIADFLAARLTEELAALWEREQRPGRDTRPGLSAQVAVLDDLLLRLRSGSLPERHELRLLLLAYGGHPDYDPAWVRLLHSPVRR